MAQEFVKSISWDESTNPAKLYIQREEPDEHSVVITSESLFTDHGDHVVVLLEVEEFEIKDDYMFATKKGANVCSCMHTFTVSRFFMCYNYQDFLFEGIFGALDFVQTWTISKGYFPNHLNDKKLSCCGRV